MTNTAGAWQLARATKYKEDEGRACFGGVPAVASTYTFFWDRSEKAFVLESNFGMDSRSAARLPVPVEAAEAFLLRCKDPSFHNRFFVQDTSKEEVRETIEAGGAKLEVCRGSPTIIENNRLLLPGLSLGLADNSSAWRVYLFHDLRKSLGEKVTKFSPSRIRHELRAA